MGRETNKSRRANQARSAREKAAAARAQQQRSDQRRRAIAILSTVVVLAVVAAVIVIAVVNHKSNQATIRNGAPPAVVNGIANVPQATLDAVGAGNIISGPGKVTGPPLTQAGKPELLYIGAEFCPYCAGERWAMAVALSRFGQLHDIGMTNSGGSPEIYPNTATLDFVHTTYTSKFLSFVPVENEDRNHNILQKVTSAQNALWAQYSQQLKLKGQGYPFLDFGNQYVIGGPSFLPTPLKGLTQTQIATKLADPNDPVAKSVDGAANLITATICKITNNQPASVCSSKTIATLQGEIDKAQSATPTPGSSS
jgi:hypothetical protein